MPYTPTTPTLTLCDQLVTALVAAWSPASPDGAERAYFVRIGDGEDAFTKLTGRRVVIFPTKYGFQAADRGENEYQHEVSVLTVERYPDAGDPPTEWTDERVDFVHTRIVDGFDYSHDGPPSWNRKLVTLSADVQVTNVEKLVTGGKLFYSLVDLVFLELRDA